MFAETIMAENGGQCTAHNQVCRYCLADNDCYHWELTINHERQLHLIEVLGLIFFLFWEIENFLINPVDSELYLH